MAHDPRIPEDIAHELQSLRQRVAELEQQVGQQLPATVAVEPAQDDAWQRAMLQLIIDSLPGAVFWKNRDLIYQGCNQFFATVAGVGSPEHIVGKSDYDLAWKTEEADWFRDTDQRVMTADIPEYHIIEPQQQADGKQAWLDTNKIPLHDNQGNVIGILGTFEDITERKQVEERLRISEERFRVLTENITATILIHRGGHILYTNPACEALTGYTTEELRDIGFAGFIHPDSLETVQQRGAARVRGEAAVPRYEIKIVTRSGEERWLDITNSLCEFDGEKAILVTAIDITRLKQSEQERIQLQESIIQSQAAALRELSTPLIPLSNNVVIMPLIGQIDTGRAQQVMETLLNGVAEQQAHTAILDVTGVPIIDTQVALALMQAANAIRLLGAQVILTGIRPDVAQSLVSLAVDLHNITTLSTLQAGIAYTISHRLA
jgi:PAS domain S-box-containing protein